MTESVRPLTPVLEPILKKSDKPKMETDFAPKYYHDLESMLPLVEDLIKESYPDCSGCKTPISDVSLIQIATTNTK